MNAVSDKKNIVLGITGSIAAYKAVELARLLVTKGFHVRVVMTKAATKFVGPCTFEAITGHPVTVDMWDAQTDSGMIHHIELADSADLIAIVPATANFIAKMRGGIADDSLSALVLASQAKVVVAPAMNVNMWNHPATKENVHVLEERGVEFVSPETGELACGWHGKGRLADLWTIFHTIRRARSSQDLAGKRVLISAGPTREPIDPVRFLSNRSSGKMGISLAREAFVRGAEVTLVHGPIAFSPSIPIRTIPVETASQMGEKMISLAGDKANPFDVVIMVAAVADFRPVAPYSHKVKKADAPDFIKVERNDDILAALGKIKAEATNGMKLVGFAVETGETEELIEELHRKRNQKGADLMVGNFAIDAFDLSTNRVWLVDNQGRHEEIATNYKSRIANKILAKIKKL